MGAIRHIPNLLTCCNLLCGCIGIFFATRGFYANAAYLIWAALIFDFLDGFSARMLKVQSLIGKELDSLADMVTFGVLPSFILFGMMRDSDLPAFLPFLAFLVAIFSALRLAKFNIDERQHTDFIGLPTPANALFISSLVFLLGTRLDILTHPYALISITVIFSFLLVSPLKMFSLKLDKGGWTKNGIKIIFLLISILCLVVFGLAGIPLTIFIYLLLSVLWNWTAKGNESEPETF